MRFRLLMLTALLAAAPVFADDNRFDKTIPFPRGGDVKLDWTFQKLTIQSVRVTDYPAEMDIEKARREDPNDRSSIGWQFRIDNRSSQKFEVKLLVEILDKSGAVIKSGDRSPTLSPHEADDVKVSTRMRTVEAADAPRVRLRAEVVTK